MATDLLRQRVRPGVPRPWRTRGRAVGGDGWAKSRSGSLSGAVEGSTTTPSRRSVISYGPVHLMLLVELVLKRREASGAGFQAIAPEENAAKTADDLLAFRDQSERVMRDTVENLAGIVSEVEIAKKEGSGVPVVTDRWLEVLEKASESTARYLPILGEIAAYKNAMARPPPLLAQFDRILRPYEKGRPDYQGEWQGDTMNLVLAPADIERMEMLESLCQDILSELSAAQTLLREDNAADLYADDLVKLVSDSATGIQRVISELP
mmetsp:Transcript_22892/g.55580  ORF Transcript_22892/g.55580 Transcript_22892/m.55580 type:complete len:265 (-) Transcript_22892:505-1299(-)